MNLKTQVSSDGKVVTIFIEGRFDFGVQQEFRDTYRYQDGKLDCYRVNLAHTEYMDSSALGMLLLLRDHAEEYHTEVVIEQPSEQIRTILKTAHFDDLFTILPAL